MFRNINSDYKIKIGIKENEIVSIDWSEGKTKGFLDKNDYGHNKIKNLLKKAISFLE